MSPPPKKETNVSASDLEPGSPGFCPHRGPYTVQVMCMLHRWLSILSHLSQHKSLRNEKVANCSVDIVRVDIAERTPPNPPIPDQEGALSQPSLQHLPPVEDADRSGVFDFTADEEDKRGNKENNERRKKRRTRKESSNNFKSPVAKPSKHKPLLSSPDFKLPRPTLGHSTPSSGDTRRQSLFGFAALESPLTLSPVAASPYIQESHFKSPEPKPARSSYTRLLGTYDIPLRNPTPRRQQKKKQQSSGELQAWAKGVNAEFAEVDEFELAVE